MSTYGLSVPALRGKQGDRTYYQCMVPNSVLNNFFPVNMEPESDRSQRTIDPKHAEDIGNYLIENSESYVLGAITYSMDMEGKFDPVKDGEDIGVLTIPMGANMRSLDGQHRRQGLKQAIDEDPDIAHDTTSILIYVEPDLLKRRQMFSDMNATPKVVAKALNVSFDTRDPFALAAVRLAKEHRLLAGHVEMQATRVKNASADYFSLAGVYDATKRLTLGLSLPRGRQPKQDPEAVFNLGSSFFDLLADSRPEFVEAAKLSEQYSGGALVEAVKALREQSILFSTTTLRAVAGAIYLCMLRHETGDPRHFAQGLAAIDFSPEAEMFISSGFLTPGKTTPNARNQEVLAATVAISDEILKNNS